MKRTLAWVLACLLLLPAPSWPSSGELIDVQGLAGTVQKTWKALDAETSTSDGVWMNVQGMSLFTLQTSGVSLGATFQIHASNAETIPSNATDGVQVGEDITTSTMTSFAGPYRWVKVKITSNSGDTLTAVMQGSTQGGAGSTSGAAGTVTIENGNTADYDTGAGTDTQTMLGIALPSDGGAVAGGTTTNPVQVAVPQSGNNLCSGRTILSAASQNETACNTSSAVLYGIRAFNASSTIHCLLVFNVNTTPVAGTDTPKQTFDVPPYTTNGQVGGWIMPMTGDGIEYDTGLGIALLSRTTAGLCTDGVTASGTTGVQVDVIYRDKP
jgi:hypothetical protein